MESTRLLSEVEKFLILDLMEYVGGLTKKYRECLLPPESGIYLVGSAKPIITTGQLI